MVRNAKWERTYSDFKIDHLVGEGRHLVVKAEAVLANGLRGEDKVALSLFLPGHYFLVIRSVYVVVYIEGAAGLDL